MTKKKKVLIGVIPAALVLGALGTFLTLNDFSGLRSLYRAKEEFWCEQQGGSYSCGEGCYCTHTTSDVGQPCTDSDQCEGLCLAVLKKQAGSSSNGGIPNLSNLDPEKYESEGVCSETTSFFESYSIMEDGKPKFVFITD